jgi:cytochrome b561
MPSTSPTTYTRTAIALHWLVALSLFGTFAMGIYMSDLPMSPTRLKLFNWHKWAGVSLLALAVLRLAWRLTHKVPAEVPGPAWQQRAARLTHLALYVLFFAVPLTGWAYSSASGFPVVWFGVLPLPDLAPVDRDLAETLKAIHKALNITMAALVLTHIAGALKHQWVDRDGLLARMWPATRTRAR